ncbi:MAG: ABC-2 type transport system permease protein [Parcubacteria group bacterium Gr01-1014_18]|nr:MAG: ABC-2 type transport system permease protein [Parcubacteria group bacterium Greene0416_36]TSC80237.1 MAG: ABC-2 type transport system permease protein [Parcubacteria group bacterium Gr01-1014_18]TSC98419.1 MAG: ABC-2 type transport system permease protein [Parcubacteria group bacterium Greene1014_20]TSD06960.1 MAG: ABC-2 type transport system permease protein [Parcubacteria group bacterium Greene0714_2]
MKKYTTLIKAFWQRALHYRFTVFAYRVGEVAEVLILILMWTTIYAGQSSIKGFTLQEMITYILIGNVFNGIVRNWLSGMVASDINEGRLSMFLVKPMSYLSYVCTKEIGRITLPVLMSVLSQILVILCFSNTFIWNLDWGYVLVISAMIGLAFISELLLSYLVGLVAFWTDEVDGLYTTMERIKKFFSGGYFPLTLLPAVFVQISFFLPFAYSFFIPAQIYLKKMDLSVGVYGLGVQVVWIAILYGVIRIVWRRGLRRYEATGI